MLFNQQIGEFDCFAKLYLRYQMRRHGDNPHWSTEEQCVELLGGVDEVYNIYALWKQVSISKQLEVCGCTIDQVRFMTHTVDLFMLESSEETLEHLVQCLDILGVL